MGGCSTCKKTYYRSNYFHRNNHFDQPAHFLKRPCHNKPRPNHSSCGCCIKRKEISRPCGIRDCRGRACGDCNYCNTCLNCRCHKYPGHFMSVNKFDCRNSCKLINYSFKLPNSCLL